MSLQIWEATDRKSHLIDHDDFYVWMKLNIASSRMTDTCIFHGTFFIYTLWNIWCARNIKVFQYAPFYAAGFASSALNQVMEWFFLAGPHLSKSLTGEINIGWEPS